MLILSCSSKLQLLEGILRKSLPQTLSVHGALMNINRGNPVGHEVLVDSWPNFKAVLTRPRREVASDNSDLYANMYAAFYHDLDAYRTLLQDTDAVNWDQTFRIHGHQNGIYEASRDAATIKQVQFSSSSYFTYLHPDPNKIRARQLDPSLTLSTLNSSHADLLNETWPYGGNEQSRRYLATLLRSFPNRCILDSNGYLISWGIMDSFGALAHGYTLPEYRGRGYMTIVHKVLSVHVHEFGYPVYGNVALNNVYMQNLNEHLGSQRLSQLCHIISHVPKSPIVS
ncbi:glycine N-acyltransferase-like protein 3 isoform X1 [Eublepharis macularius]|uniref:Glycine N-acyltransferase-like protein n=1 Tax=Eublepharis macularius TaxID=481883 RepID=A0AA97KPR4_EUBMA|nr:glycine N-acyltransferase-like protein 3 isoform X1 [Eublepharis macularius]